MYGARDLNYSWTNFYQILKFCALGEGNFLDLDIFVCLFLLVVQDCANGLLLTLCSKITLCGDLYGASDRIQFYYMQRKQSTCCTAFFLKSFLKPCFFLKVFLGPQRLPDNIQLTRFCLPPFWNKKKSNTLTSLPYYSVFIEFLLFLSRPNFFSCFEPFSSLSCAIILTILPSLKIS